MGHLRRRCVAPERQIGGNRRARLKTTNTGTIRWWACELGLVEATTGCARRASAIRSVGVHRRARERACCLSSRAISGPHVLRRARRPTVFGGLGSRNARDRAWGSLCCGPVAFMGSPSRSAVSVVSAGDGEPAGRGPRVRAAIRLFDQPAFLAAPSPEPADPPHHRRYWPTLPPAGRAGLAAVAVENSAGGGLRHGRRSDHGQVRDGEHDQAHRGDRGREHPARRRLRRRRRNGLPSPTRCLPTSAHVRPSAARRGDDRHVATTMMPSTISGHAFTLAPHRS